MQTMQNGVIKQTNGKVKTLSKPMKIAATHAYTDLGFSTRKIAELLGIDRNSVMRYQNKELEDEWSQFSATIKKIYQEQDFELAELAVKHIKAKIDKARFFELVGLLKTVRELQKEQAPIIAQNFDIATIWQSMARGAVERGGITQEDGSVLMPSR